MVKLFNMQLFVYLISLLVVTCRKKIIIQETKMLAEKLLKEKFG